MNTLQRDLMWNLIDCVWIILQSEFTFVSKVLILTFLDMQRFFFPSLLGNLVNSRSSSPLCTLCTLLVLSLVGRGAPTPYLCGDDSQFLGSFYLWKMTENVRKVENLKEKRTMCSMGKSCLRNVSFFLKSPGWLWVFSLLYLRVALNSWSFYLHPKFWDYRFELVLSVIHLFFVFCFMVLELKPEPCTG